MINAVLYHLRSPWRTTKTETRQVRRLERVTLTPFAANVRRADEGAFAGRLG